MPDSIKACGRAIGEQYAEHMECAIDTALAILLAVLFALLIFQIFKLLREVAEAVGKWCEGKKSFEEKEKKEDVIMVV